MEIAVSAAKWVVGKALAPVTDGFLESWAASTELGNNIRALKMELLYAHGMLENAQGRDVRGVALKELLHTLRQLAYRADDAIDELDYFRIQDALDGTYHAADVHARGFVRGLALNARHAARGMANKLKLPSCSCAASTSRGDSGDHDHECGSRLLCGVCKTKATQRNRNIQPPKLKFNRAEMSTKILDIIEELKPVCAKVSTILNLELLGSSRTPSQQIAMSRPKTTPEIIEPKLYGRDDQKKSIVDSIANGKYQDSQLTVLPIVGPGGIGKTTFTQHIYDHLKSHFDVTIWICVSLNFSATRLVQEIVNKIPTLSDEKNGSAEELIEQRLKSKSFLLVLDDVWTHRENEWKKLLAPFKKVGSKGNMVIVTTRIPEVANNVRTTDFSLELGSLDHTSRMLFFEACVFDEEKPWDHHPLLHDVGRQIVPRLKGSPLATKTVGRLLRKKLTVDHWTSVLESKEWESQTSDDDIMPALKLSYDCLPFHLQQCFSHCGLFPEDYEFDSKELVHLWVGLGILHFCDQNNRTEDVGLSYLNELFNHGFFKKNKKKDGSPCYVIHDLLHELAVKMSSHECLSIYSSNVRSILIPPSVHHLSIIVDDKDVKDRSTFQDYNRNLCALDKRLNVENLHTLMLFGQYHGNFAKTFGDLFSEAKSLRTIFLSDASYSVEDILHNFSKTVHLRYIRIKFKSSYEDVYFPLLLFRLYHLEIIDLEEWDGSFVSMKHVTNLVKLRHFLVPRDELHSDMPEVGKLKLFQELRRFEVGKESKGFELSQLGQLTELGGSLGIYNLENVQPEEETNELKPIHKNRLHTLRLEWCDHRPNKDPRREEKVLESLIPQNNLQELCIRGHGGAYCPTWLGESLSVKNLESLCLDNVSWKTFPPIGDCGSVEEPQGGISSQSFQNLKSLKLVNIPNLRKWVATKTCQLFSHLKVLEISGCPELVELSFSCSTCYQAEQKQGSSMFCFPALRKLKIGRCPKLTTVPLIHWTQALRLIKIAEASSSFRDLEYKETGYGKPGFGLDIGGAGGTDSLFWNKLALCSFRDLKELSICDCPPLTLDLLQMLTSLEFIQLRRSNVVLPPMGGESQVTYQFPVECLWLRECALSGKELTQLLSLFPRLTNLRLDGCDKITELGVVEQQQETREEDEIAMAAEEREGRLLLPTRLETLEIERCSQLSIVPSSVGDSNTEAAGGLQRLRSLRILEITDSPKCLSFYLCSSSSCFPFPTSLEQLLLWRVESMETLEALSNLTSLTNLEIQDCGDVRGEGIWPLMAHGQLTNLTAYGNPKFFVAPKHAQELGCRSSKLESTIYIQGSAGLLPVPICSLLSSSLTGLTFRDSREVEPISEEALQLLPYLKHLMFYYCDNMQFLPQGLHRLARLEKLEIDRCGSIWSLRKDGLPISLQELYISSCPAMESLPKDSLPTSLHKLEICNCESIKSLPKDSLPSSLQKLVIIGCSSIKSLPEDGLPSCLQELEIGYCPALKSLPEVGLPSCLQELEIGYCPALKSLPEVGLPSSLIVLDVSRGNSVELKRECRKLIGTIPIIIIASQR